MMGAKPYVLDKTHQVGKLLFKFSHSETVCANPRSPVGYRRFPVPYLKSPASKQAFSCSMQVISCGVKNGAVVNLLFGDILEGIKNQEAFVSYILLGL